MQMRTADVPAAPVWAITSYFNPSRFQRRRLNYEQFSRALSVPLVTAELSLDGAFELSSCDADVLIQVHASAPLWHKESLLNVALRSVPDSVPFVAWLDCDIVLERRDWPDALVSRLSSCELVQLFDELHDLDANESLREAVPATKRSPTGYGIVSLLEQGRIPPTAFAPQCTNDMRTTSFGIAWGARTSLLRRHGFYDAMILGSGDRAMLCAALDECDATIRSLQLSPARAAHYLAWARPYFARVSGQVGHISGRVYHLWHGEIANRNYKKRHELLAAKGFDPDADLEKSPAGVWQWKRPRPDLDQFLRSYFRDRREDDVETT